MRQPLTEWLTALALTSDFLPEGLPLSFDFTRWEGMPRVVTDAIGHKKKARAGKAAQASNKLVMSLD